MIYDVTVPITNTMPVWPSDPQVNLQPESHTSRDGSHTIQITKIDMGSHTGTHLDAPYHMMKDGRRLDEIPLEILMGPATVIELPGIRSISKSAIENQSWTGTQRVLFKTDNSNHWNDGKFYEEFVYLEPEAAELLVEQGIQLVGIDYLSIDKYKSPAHPTHFVLLKKNVVIIEGLNLSAVPAGTYHMTALPLNLWQADGAPTRVLLAQS